MAAIRLPHLPITWHPSPNTSPRPAGCPPALIVLHSTGGSYTGALSWLCNPGSGVSAHFLVGRDGRVAQLVALERAAWHAGVSAWQGRTQVNRFSIGIEMAHIDRKEDWPPAQLIAVATLCRALCARYNLPTTAIVGHAAVVRPQGRKADPLGFPWERVR